jgi:hypothetical protein
VSLQSRLHTAFLLDTASVVEELMLTFSDSDDEDETAALMAELAKIKQERAEEKARQVSNASHHNVRPVFSPLLAVIDLRDVYPQYCPIAPISACLPSIYPADLARPPALADIQDAETSAKSSADRDQEIATGNPLLNLQNALGQSPAPSATSSATASFSVKRRWDDDLIFKNQAAGLDDKPKKGEFVNDLLRSEFHKKFMLK